MVRSIGFALILSLSIVPGVFAADGNRLAVVIGAQNYNDQAFEPLEYTEQDATQLASALKAAGYKVALLTDAAGREDKTLEPTKAKIEAALGAMLENRKRDDLVLVAFAGHGIKLDGKPESYLCPKDAKLKPTSTDSLISVDAICQRLEKCGAVGKVLLVDACRNRQKTEGHAGIEGDKVKVPEGVLALFSCSSGERALEHKEIQHGLFFHEALEGLKGKAADGNDNITFASLAQYVCKEVPARASKLDLKANQTPVQFPRESTALSPVLALHPEAIPLAEWKEYLGVWSRGSTQPFLQMHAKRFAAWKKAAESGSARGMMLLADCYDFGVGTPKNPKECARWYEKGAKHGNSFAMVGYGICLQSGSGVEKNPKEAFSWFRKSAELGDPGGMDFLGSCYFRGSGVAKNEEEGARWYRKSAEMGFGQAMSSLGQCYLNGSGVKQDEKEALRWFRQGSELGNHLCMVDLGFAYQNGIGVEKDTKVAVKWYRKAAEAGDATAMNLLGLCYQEGEGTDEDAREAVKWFRKAAELDNAWGMFNLGSCYLSGTGVAKDKAEAFRWVKKAAAKGFPRAKELLDSIID